MSPRTTTVAGTGQARPTTARRCLGQSPHEAFVHRNPWREPAGHMYTTCQNRACVNPEHITDSQEEAHAHRFNHYIDKQDNGCWLWTKGNSLAFVAGQNARQFAYSFYYDKPPKGAYVRAVCEEPRCVSPAHIYIYDRDTLKGYETCIKGHPQIPGNMARNKRTGQAVCGICLRQKLKESA